jgi:Zn-dependent M28 family amino/carboxypeptidase
MHSPLRSAAAAAAIAGMLVAAPAASAAPPTDSSALRSAVTPAGILAHEQALQAIADANDGTRASGTPGYDASLAYVKGKLDATGYFTTRVQEFDFAFFSETAPPVFERVSPSPRTYANPGDFVTMEYSGSGDVTAAVQEVNDNQFPPGPTASSSNAGCETADFAGFVAGRVALIQRGTCDFAVKARNAEAAGASAVVIFNEGQEGRQEALNGTLGGPGFAVPVLGTSFAVGEELHNLLQSGPVTVHVRTTTQSETRRTANLIADTKTGRTDRAVVVGAHLDSVPEGPGINDNGSGSSQDLEVALQMARLGVRPANQVRFAWWGAEESGLIGSQFYVDSLTSKQVKSIAVNLNFDMVGSPNYVRFVYDGDASDTESLSSTGSGVVEDVFTDYFTSQGLPSEPTAFDGRSDYDAFISVGIPAGGLFTGAEDIKTAEEAAIYGGTAGVAYDPCYHQACDTLANLSTKALDEMSDASAHATLTFAQSTSAVQGTDKGKALGHGEFKGNELRR